MEPKRPTLRHIIIKMTRLKDKESILKATRKKIKIKTGSYIQGSNNETVT